MRRYYLWILVIFFSLTVGYQILALWRGVILSQKNLSEERLLKAIKVDPGNPEPFHKLGILHQWGLLHIDLKQSGKYIRKAIERNPLDQKYWLNLAKVFQRMEEGEAFERALENSILVFPTSFQGRWTTGNLLLQQEALEKALPHFSYILTHYPNQSSVVYDVWGKVVNDQDFFLERIVPKDPYSLNRYITYLYESGDKESAKKAWGKKISLGYKADRGETLRHIDFLISQGELNEAFQVWKTRLKEEGLPIPSDGNLITNSGFEKEKALGGGFDWKIENVPGAKISFDQSVAFEGKSSLKITFDGKENIDFHHIYQLVVLKPHTDYLLKAYMKAKAVTTKSGLRMEILGVGPAFYGASESLIGDHEWKELSVAFRTPAQSNGGWVRVRRERTDKFDRFISGAVWIDDIQLKEIKP
jgi:tetratricopeptide (TPR) repeat protein